MKRLFRPESVFFLGVLLVLLVAFRERGFYDPGALWHVRVGELILGGSFPRTDPFTFTFAGHRWVPQQWGAEVLMALAHRAGGFDTLLLGLAALVAGLFTAVFRRGLRAGMGPPLAGLVVGLFLFVGAFHFFVRPHMLTIALLGWTMMSVVDFERGRCTAWRLAGLIPLYVAWTNLHGGVLGGTLTLGLAVAGWGCLFLGSQVFKSQVASQHTEGPPPDLGLETCRPVTPIRDWRTALLLVGVVAACALTPFVNPFGLELLHTWWRIVGSKVVPQVITEHMRLDPTSGLGAGVIGLGVLYLGLLAGTLPGRPRVTWLIPLVWLVLSVKSIRQGPLFAITAAVAVVDLWPHTVWHRLLVKYGDGSLARGPDPAAAAGGVRWLAVPVAVVLLALGLQVAGVAAPVVGRGWARLDPRMVPTELADELRAYAARVPPGTPIYNDANLGGFLIYHTPTLKIFMDDRCELYGDEHLGYYVETINLPPAACGERFEHWARAYGFERAVVVTGRAGDEKPPLEAYLVGVPGRWREVARCDRAAVFERVR